MTRALHRSLSHLYRHPTLTLGVLGLLSELIYLSYVLLFPLPLYSNAPRPYDMEQIARPRHWMGIAWSLGVLAVYLAFMLALMTVQSARSPALSRLVLFFGCLFGLTLIWLYPITATDLFQYVLRARIWVVHHANPMSTPPAVFPDDPLLPFAGEWRVIASPYGPFWELLAGSIARLGFVTPLSGALAYKSVAFGGYLVCMMLLHRMARAWKKNGAAGVLFFAWNPLVLIQGVGNGHNDMVMLAWMLLALLVWRRNTYTPQVLGRSLLSIAAMTSALLTKASAGLLSFLLALDILRGMGNMSVWRRVALLAAMGGVVATLALLAFAPFWPPWHSVIGVLDEMRHRYTYTIAATLRLWLGGFMSARAAWDAPRTAGQLLFWGVLGWVGLRLWQRRLDLVSAGFLAYFAYLISGASYRIWYPLWLVPLAALSVSHMIRQHTLLLCLTSELSIVFFYFVWRWMWPQASWLQMHLLVVPWQFGLPLFLPIVLRAQWRRQGQPR
ncbi:MAG: hypothetical protein ACUVSF_04190 [Anaerolineae bacterium]